MKSIHCKEENHKVHTFKKDLQALRSQFKKSDKTFNKVDNDVLQQKLEEIDNYINDTDNANVLADLLAEKFHSTALEMLKSFTTKNDLQMVKTIANLMSTITEYSEKFSEELVAEGAPDLLIHVAIKFGSSGVSEQDGLLCDHIHYYILRITYNIIRYIRFHRCFLSHADIDQFRMTIQPRMSSKVINTRILATFVMAWLTKEDLGEKSVIEKDSHVINEICEYIKEVIKIKEKCYRGYSLWELLIGAQGLVSIDSIKAQMADNDSFIPSLITILSSELSKPKELEASLSILWSLSFVKKNLEILKDEYHVDEIVKPLTKSDNESIRKRAKGLLWDLEKKRKLSQQQKLQYDVFISYSHAQKEPIAKLAGVLRQHFKLWIDTDNIKGSGLNDMATGIEQSAIFLMAVSNSYKQSQCCRSEANWAFKLNKPILPLIMVHKYNPDGWLGMMISSETYIDYSEKSNSHDAIERIIQHIKFKSSQMCNDTACSINTVTDGLKCENKRELKCTSNPPELPENIRTWNSQDVSNWLTANNLTQLKTKFVDFDGGMVLALKNMMNKTYEKYNDHLEKEFKMSMTEILKLDSALGSLQI